jgi:flagellar basal-body rod protein FlgF/flagellar basal-body rod protein FlgG
MDSGYYAACAGLAAQMESLEVLGHNLANLSTAGYRGEQTTFRSILTGRGTAGWNAVNDAVNDYGVLSGSRLDLSAGSLAPTGNPLDLAVAGKGFFVLQSGEAAGAKKEMRYTRNGGFHVSPAGQLVTSQGDSVMGQSGPVILPNGNVVISSDGTVSVDGNVVDQLRLAGFSPSTDLTPIGNATYTAPAGSARPAADSTVEQGMLEGSNVNPAEAMVELIQVQRNAEMLGRVVGALDGEMNQTAVEDLPKV